MRMIKRFLLYPEERQKIIDNLDINIIEYQNGISKNNKLVRQYTKSTK